MNMAEEKTLPKQLTETITKILDKHGAKKIAIFGSYAKGTQTSESDIDILVEFKETKTLIEIVKIEQEITQKLGIKAEIVTENSLNPYIKRRAQKEAITVKE